MTPTARSSFANEEAYELRVGRWSRAVAPRFLEWLAVPAGAAWLDAGAGPGALADAIVARCAPSRVVALDRSLGALWYGCNRRPDGRLSSVVADAADPPFPERSFDVVVSALALNFLPDPVDALRRMARAATRGGTIAAYLWDFGGEMQPHRRFWDAAIALDPDAARFDQARKFTLCRPGALGELFRAAGLRDVEERAIDVEAVFRGFDDLWLPFVTGGGSVVEYARSLPDERLRALRERVLSSVTADPDGRIHLLARALAGRGRVAAPEE